MKFSNVYVASKCCSIHISLFHVWNKQKSVTEFGNVYIIGELLFYPYQFISGFWNKQKIGQKSQ